MDSCDLIDSIKAEKANALARYRRFTNITKLFQLIEVLVAVAVISWSTSRLPFVFKFSGEYVMAFPSYLMNQHVVFLVGNVIVVVCYVLSRYTDSGNESGDSEIRYDDGKFNRLTHRKRNSVVQNAKPTPKQVTTGSSAVSEVQNPVIQNENSVIKTKSEISQITAETVIKQAAKQIERFQRTKSDKLKSQISMKPHRELRRSVTEMRRSMTVTSGGQLSTVKSFQAVEKLSNEEFRIAVETFISKQQRLQKQQSMVEDDS